MRIFWQKKWELLQEYLIRNMKFTNPDSSYFEEIKEKLLDGFREEESFGYMRGHEGWEKIETMQFLRD